MRLNNVGMMGRRERRNEKKFCVSFFECDSRDVAVQHNMSFVEGIQALFSDGAHTWMAATARRWMAQKAAKDCGARWNWDCGDFFFFSSCFSLNATKKRETFKISPIESSRGRNHIAQVAGCVFFSDGDDDKCRSQKWNCFQFSLKILPFLM